MRTPRLPGLRFETQQPPLAISLPRMDIAVFVGFAAAGPLHHPVAIEDPGEFANVFGQDLQLAWDPERNEAGNAYLGPAVRAFFRNGGRRCWVIRVADTPATLARWQVTRPAARSNRFPLVGLLGLDPSTGLWSQAAVDARSEGSWSDGVRVGTELDVEPMRAVAWVQTPTGMLAFGGDLHANFAPGDLLRLTWPDLGYVVLLTIDTVSAAPPLTSPLAPPARWVSGPAVWFSTTVPPPVAATAARAWLFDGALEPTELPLVGSTLDEHGALVLHLGVQPGAVPSPGALVRVEFATFPPRTVWLTVGDSPGSAPNESPVQDGVTIHGDVLAWLPDAPLLPASSTRVLAERLTFDLHARLGFERWAGQAASYPMRLSNLGFAAAHPRYWASLPLDADLYPLPNQPPSYSPDVLALQREVSTPRFPLAGAGDTGQLYLPLALTRVLDPTLMAGPAPSPDTELERDGLSSFGADLFLDGELADADVLALLDEADFLRYQQPLPRSLSGMHATLGLGEPALISIPDAVHRGWKRDVSEPPPVVVTPASPLQLDDCNPALTSLNAPGLFTACDALPAVTLFDIEPPADASYSVTWSTLTGPDIQYALDESTADNFADSTIAYRGPAATTRLEGRSEGTYFYRVRAETTSEVGAWSNIVGVRVGVTFAWRMLSANEFASAALETVHLGVLTLSAAAGDLLAVLALPAHYREDASIEHVGRLASRVTYDRDRTLSFGALYHPWRLGRDDAAGAVRQTPPDGTISGMIAARTLTRGAWTAPANETLQQVLALVPPLARERRLDLQEGHVNVLRQEPSGFRVLSARTLSDDETVQPINVRRLLSLLRRLAAREGANYVFEPNDAAFRRLVERGFEALLDDLFLRGAFAGAIPQEAYQVNTGGVVNTPRDQDAGRFIVELKVAPSQPLTFLTIRLLQQGQRDLTVLEG